MHFLSMILVSPNSPLTILWHRPFDGIKNASLLFSLVNLYTCNTICYGGLSKWVSIVPFNVPLVKKFSLKLKIRKEREFHIKGANDSEYQNCGLVL